jgi:hypothetical protein
MADYAISGADLSGIESNMRNIASNLDTIDNNIHVLNSNVTTVDDNVKVIYDQVGTLARDFHEFVSAQQRANRMQIAETRVVKYAAELDQKFGHYGDVRRTTTGILQADDLGIVRKETISTATEELMLNTPGYWLSPCLVALAAWIQDQPDLAEKALKEGIRRNDEKTSLLFALICRRADRKQASLKWTQRYLACQDEENLDRKAVVMLDAFASGLLGADTEGIISKQMTEWLDHLADKPGFVEQQTEQWSEAIVLKKPSLAGTNGYPYLRKYSHTWPVLQEILEGAYLHAEVFNYFSAIFDKEVTTAALKEQLDTILNSLVTDYDDEELPLRKDLQYEKYVIQYNGDEVPAKASMDVEQSAFETHKDFTQLLTDAAMKPENSHSSPSTQKFAIALSKEWIRNAYNDITAKNRAKSPSTIELNVDSYNGSTTDGRNEAEQIQNFEALIAQEKAAALAGVTLTGFENFCLYGGAVIAVIGLIMLFTGAVFLGLIAAIAGAGMVINHFSKKNGLEAKRQNIINSFDTKLVKGEEIIRAMLAEVVDFRSEFSKRDAESQKVIDFLDQISPDQYVKKLSDSTRRVKI